MAAKNYPKARRGTGLLRIESGVAAPDEVPSEPTRQVRSSCRTRILVSFQLVLGDLGPHAVVSGCHSLLGGAEFAALISMHGPMS